MDINGLARTMLDKIHTDLSRRTEDYYASKMAAIASWDGWPDDVTQIRQKHIDAYVKHRRAQGVGASLVKELGALQRAFRLSRIRPEWEVYREDLPRTRRDVNVPLDQDVRRIWELMRDEPGLRLGSMLALFAGLRAEEVPKLEWKDVNFSERVIHIPGDIRKTGEPNAIPMCDTLYARLSNEAVASDVANEFDPGSSVIGMTDREVRNAFKRITYKQGITWSGFQRWRRLLVTWAEDDGHDLEQIALVTGHRRRSITSRYTETAGKLKHKLAIITSVEDRFLRVIDGNTTKSDDICQHEKLETYRVNTEVLSGN